MNKTLVIIGVIALVLAVIAYSVTVVEEDSALGGLVENEDTERPYRYLAIPLFFVGLVLIIVGVALKNKS